jgi:hypothetical protein
MALLAVAGKIHQHGVALLLRAGIGGGCGHRHGGRDSAGLRFGWF